MIAEAYDAYAGSAVASGNGGGSNAVNQGVDDGHVVPLVAAVGSDLKGVTVERVVDGEIEHIVAQAAINSGVFHDVGRGIEHLSPRGKHRVTCGDGLVGAVDADEGDAEADDAVASVGGGHRGIKCAGGGEDGVTEGDAADAVELYGSGCVVGWCCHREEQTVGGVVADNQHGCVCCVSLSCKVPSEGAAYGFVDALEHGSVLCLSDGHRQAY